MIPSGIVVFAGSSVPCDYCIPYLFYRIAATLLSATSLVTRDLAPIREPLPITLPGNITELIATTANSSTVTSDSYTDGDWDRSSKLHVDKSIHNLLLHYSC